MARLLVAHNYHLPLDPWEHATGKPYPPLGTLVSAAAARAAGHDVAVYDPMFTRDVGTFAEALAGHRPAKVALLADPHAVAQKMCLTSMREAGFTMIRLAKQAGAEVLVAGPDASDRPEAWRAAGADVVVVGEHDRAFLAWAAGGGPAAIVPRAAPMEDLAGLPFPAWDLVDLPRYRDAWRARHGLWEMNVSTARGCPYRCNWCAKPTWGRTWHARPPAEVAAEVRALRDRWGVDRVWFTDDIFAVRRDWLTAYRRAIGDTPVPYRCLTRADLVREGGYLEDLRASGCEEVWIGAESGSDAVLAAMDKDTTVAEIREAAQRLAAAGIRRGFFLQLGYPGETYQDVLKTLEMVRELRPEALGISVSYPLPGTPFHERMAHRLVAATWDAAMENRLLFRADHPQAFYDAAREVLRAEHAVMSFRPAASRRGLRRGAGAAWHAMRWPWWRSRLWWHGRRPTPDGQSS